jgi:MFS family permease
VCSLTLILLTDRFGRRLIVVTSAIVCTITMLVVSILSFVPKTDALKNFLIFTACIWSFFNIALGSVGWAFVGKFASQALRAKRWSRGWLACYVWPDFKYLCSHLA